MWVKQTLIMTLILINCKIKRRCHSGEVVSLALPEALQSSVHLPQAMRVIENLRAETDLEYLGRRCFTSRTSWVVAPKIQCLQVKLAGGYSRQYIGLQIGKTTEMPRRKVAFTNTPIDF